MSYQQKVYHYLVRCPDPLSVHEVARGTGLPPLVASYALCRLNKRYGLVERLGAVGRGCKWRVVDDTVQFIPDRRGKAEGSLAALEAIAEHRRRYGRGTPLQSYFSHGVIIGGTVRPQET